MKTALSVIILGVVVLTALAALSAFGAVFASIGTTGAFSDTLTQAAGALFAFSRVGLLAAVVLVAIYAVAFVDWTGGEDAKAPAEKPPGGERHSSMD